MNYLSFVGIASHAALLITDMLTPANITKAKYATKMKLWPSTLTTPTPARQHINKLKLRMYFLLTNFTTTARMANATV